ncbi:MAG: SPOR domain-containing protein [Polaromonas sp.]|nr:SPOR domain-containing protein [Polaromonas sp.]
MKKQRGGTLLGFILGALIGLGAALAVAVYITKVPMPFMNKTPPRAAENEAAEAQRNRDWDPNTGLANRPVVKPVPAEAAPAAGPSADPLGDLARAKVDAAAGPAAAPPPMSLPALSPPVTPAAAPAAGADPFNYFVQAGAFRTPEDAEQQRAKVALMGLMARVSEREQSGRVVYRVRLGPFDKKDDADKAKTRLDSGGVEAALVRVQK